LVTVQQGHKALGELEEVAIGSVRCEIDVENGLALGGNLHDSGSHIEGVLDPLTGCLIQNREQRPFYLDREAEFVF